MHVQLTKNGAEYRVTPGHEWFWPGFENNTWEPNTFKIFDRFLSNGDTFLDIGAWIGPTTMYASRRVKKVIAFEPDPVAFSSLTKNIELNELTNVEAFPFAVSDHLKWVHMGAKTGYGDSMTSEVWAGSDGTIRVPAIPLASLITETGASFIKIDIEGGEKNIFDGIGFTLSVSKPTVYLSLHTPWFKDNFEEFVTPIMKELSVFPYFYDEELNPIQLGEAFDTNKFTAIVATFIKL